MSLETPQNLVSTQQWLKVDPVFVPRLIPTPLFMEENQGLSLFGNNRDFIKCGFGSWSLKPAVGCFHL